MNRILTYILCINVMNTGNEGASTSLSFLSEYKYLKIRIFKNNEADIILHLTYSI